MGVKKWFGLESKPPARRTATKPPPPPNSGPNSSDPASNVSSVRKDLLRVVMREALHRNGIPPHWLAAEILRTLNAKREPGFHLRILVRHWDPRLMLHAVAFERNLQQRLQLLDPKCTDWLVGFSWQFLLPEGTQFPPLPPSSAWTELPDPDPLEEEAPSTRGADVIQGPVHIGAEGNNQNARAQLERLLSARDDDLRAPQNGFDPTRPDKL